MSNKKLRKNLLPASESSLGTVQLQARASRNTGNKFSQMLTHKYSTSSSVINNTRKRTRGESAKPTSILNMMTDTTFTKKTSDTRTVQNKIVDLTLGDDGHNHDNENYRNNQSEDDSHYGNSFESLDSNYSGPDGLDCNRDDIEVQVRIQQTVDPQTNNPQINKEDITQTYITKDEFDYAMQLLDKKITSVYRLCKFISETQQVEKKSLERLIALDELTDSFWNRAFESNQPVTPEIISQIAEKEKRDEETHRKKQKSSSQVSNFGGSEATIEDELDDYDNFITGLEKTFN
ncbi:unnamed protein product [Rhizophagus irregularis]|nr:unnamed protein product [Rhizophagus irregularis]